MNMKYASSFIYTLMIAISSGISYPEFNISINNTLSRTVMTSITTLLALISLYLFGGEVIKPFALTMIIGVLVGTYSSIFIAVPTLLVFKFRPQDEDENGN